MSNVLEISGSSSLNLFVLLFDGESQHPSAGSQQNFEET
jgi:hypothetical protein